jgi:hypothetical protein
MNALRLSFHARRARPRDPRPTARDDVRARAMDGPRAVRAIEGSLRFAFATIAGVARADDCAARDPPPRTRRERDPTCRGLADWSCDAMRRGVGHSKRFSPTTRFQYLIALPFN